MYNYSCVRTKYVTNCNGTTWLLLPAIYIEVYITNLKINHVIKIQILIP